MPIMLPMRKNKFTAFAAAFFILLFLSACMKYNEVSIVGVTDVKLQEVNTSNVEVAIGLRVKNPNNYKITIADADLQVYIKGVKLGNVVMKNKVVLPKKSDLTHDVIITGKPAQMSLAAIPTLIGLMGKNKSVQVQVKGEIKARAKNISKKFPVDFSDQVSLRGDKE